MAIGAFRHEFRGLVNDCHGFCYFPLLHVEIDEREWGVLVDPDSGVKIDVWIEGGDEYTN